MDYTASLGRSEIKIEIQNMLEVIQDTRNDLTKKRCVYLYGDTGVGKTTFIMNILKELDYDIVRYDAGDVRNKNVVAMISRSHISEKSVISMFQQRQRPIAIVMDDIDGMNSGDKGGINALIKLVRPKKTKKQKLEDKMFNLIICVGNSVSDKKIKELMKVCHCFELPTPNKTQMSELINANLSFVDDPLRDSVSNFVKGDLNKLEYLRDLANRNRTALSKFLMLHRNEGKRGYEDVKDITTALFNKRQSINRHNSIMNETDRTIVALSWHENVIDHFEHFPTNMAFSLYLVILKHICFGDYIDRLMFQHQVWQLNEMTSLIKTFYNNNLFHVALQSNKLSNVQIASDDVRFTKVLTKYSTEYNNKNFIASICKRLSMDYMDAITMVMRSQGCENTVSVFADYEISKLDVDRVYRYVNVFN